MTADLPPGEAGGPGEPEEADGLPPGTLIGGYRLEGRIGNGGMATVYRARDEQLGRLVALKLLSPAMTLDAEFRNRFVRESEAASLVDHPNIIPVYAAGQDRGFLYLAMKHVSGGDLHSVVEREGQLAPDRAISLLSPIASALDAAHRAGIVHRDVKPANVLVDRGPGRPDHPYLSDFGLARRDDASVLTATGAFVGTASFASPEQISGKAPQSEADQYALACVAYTLLTASLPFRHASPEAVLWAQMSKPPPQVVPQRGDLSSAVDDVIARALAKEPADRYPTCGDFVADLDRALREAPVPAGSHPLTVPSPQPPPTPPTQPVRAARPAWPEPESQPWPEEEPTRRRRRSRSYGILAICGAGVVVVAMGVVGALALRGPNAAGTPRSASATSPAPRVPTIGVTPVKTLSAPSAASGATPELAFGPDGTLVALSEGGTSVDVISISSGKLTATYPLGSPAQPGSGLTLDGDTFLNPGGACVGGTGPCGFDVHQWWRKSGIGGMGALGGDVVAYGDSTVALSLGNGVRVSSVETVRRPTDMPVPGNRRPQELALSPDGGTVAAATQPAGSSHRLYVWSIATRSVKAAIPVPPSMGAPEPDASGPAIPMAVSGTTLAVSDYQKTNVYAAATGRLLTTVGEPLMGLSPDGKLFVTADPSSGNLLDLRDSATGVKVGTIGPQTGDSVARIAFSPDGHSIAAVCGDGTYIWKLSEG